MENAIVFLVVESVILQFFHIAGGIAEADVVVGLETIDENLRVIDHEHAGVLRLLALDDQKGRQGNQQSHQDGHQDGDEDE